MAKTVIGFFDNTSDAQQAVENLVDNNIARENIDISSSRYDNENSGSMNSGTMSAESGMGSGGGMGTGSNMDSDRIGLDSMGSGSMSSGIGMNSGSMSSDSSMSSESGMGRNNSYTDRDTNRTHESGIGKFFRNLFGNDDEADRYSKVAERADTIVTVHAQSTEEAELAAQIMDDYGAVDVDRKAAEYGYASNSMQTNENMSGKTNNDSDSISVIEEQVEVGKREVETGGIRLKSRIVERPVEENLRLREERVRVERNTVDRPASASDLDNFQEREIEVVERAEVADVTKEARVVEEVKLNKEVEHRN